VNAFNQSIQLISDYLFCYINRWATIYLVLGWKYLPKSFYTRFWRLVEQWFTTLLWHTKVWNVTNPWIFTFDLPDTSNIWLISISSEKPTYVNSFPKKQVSSSQLCGYLLGDLLLSLKFRGKNKIKKTSYHWNTCITVFKQ
jgi:hypothetical protein